MSKNSTNQALIKYFERQDIKPTKTFRKNEKPEKEVEREVLKWCRENKFFVSVVESKAVYSSGANRFLRGQADPGFPDIVGLNNSGLFLGIELKAKGRRSTLRVHQYLFLKNIIANHGFALVTDSADFLSQTYQKYLQLSCKDRPDYLTSLLPIPRDLREDNTPIFQDP